MHTVLIVGIDSVIGANLALCLVDRYSVHGLWQREPIFLDGCAVSACPEEHEHSVRKWVATVRPRWIVYCGPAARSAWQTSPAAAAIQEPEERQPQIVAGARNWVIAASQSDCPFTMISSDAVFTGPWMFHAETSRSYCPTPQALTLRAAERAVIETCPNALIVRTHAFGWSPGTSSGSGWIEDMLCDLRQCTLPPADTFRHATPILATDLAVVLERAYRTGLSGVYHVAGTERVNPHQFVQRLADRLELPSPTPGSRGTLLDRPAGLGAGETSLRCRKIRKALRLPLPMLDEGLARLRDQHHNGHRDRLQSAAEPVRDKVA